MQSRKLARHVCADIRGRFIVKKFIVKEDAETGDRSHALHFYELRVMEIFDKIRQDPFPD